MNNTYLSPLLSALIQRYQQTGQIPNTRGMYYDAAQQARQQRQAQFWANMQQMMQQQNQQQQPEQQNSGGPGMPSNISQFWNGGSAATGTTAGTTTGTSAAAPTGATAGTGGSSWLSSLGSGAAKALPWVGLGLIARNAFEKDTIGGETGKFMRQMDPNSGHSMRELPREFFRGQWKEWVDPVRQTTRGIKAIKKLFK